PRSPPRHWIHYPYILSLWERIKVRAAFPHPNLLPEGEGTADTSCLTAFLRLSDTGRTQKPPGTQ
ncbi:MAG: hypothetical protein Q8P59_13365, partial [Dehalococcoidia bacterium]|nr:hypothetical protein [Dehalococcoidia bacterium]